MPDQESQILPFEAIPIAGERLLVFAPHPDDEVIGCGGLIALHGEERRQVRVIVATDGAAADVSATNLASLRESESREGLALLGTSDVLFWRFPDRKLSEQPLLIEKITEAIVAYDPDLIAVPSPVEVHPDHLALARAVVEALQQMKFAVSPALTRVLFYEVSQPFRPTALLDITSVAEAKFEAIRRHQSQVKLRPYDHFARGLNAYRALTLGSETQYAEAYVQFSLHDLRTRPWSSLVEAASPNRPAEWVGEVLPITVVVRTRNRLPLLRDAIASVRQSSYPAQLLVVNDGGTSPADLLEPSELLDLSQQVGRSEAMNLAVRKADTSHIAFLDDDDIHYPEHLATLATRASRETFTAFYSDAVSLFFERRPDGSLAERDRLRIFSESYDPQLLLLDNYIPLLTLLLRRDDYLEAGGFDKELELFEDWDFLLRLSRRGSFLHVPRLTCEIRHYPDGNSLALAAGRDSSVMAAGKRMIWERHSGRIDFETLSAFVERRKRLLEHLTIRAESESGRAKHLTLDVTRLSREKKLLLEQLAASHRHASEVTATRDAAAEHARRLELHNQQITTQVGELERHQHELERHRQELQGDQETSNQLVGQLYAEVERLNQLIAAMESSRAWRLHSLAEKVRGRR